ncbi:MAG: penicillin-binding transpeptidase domain-containing protein [Sarcina sp.]
MFNHRYVLAKRIKIIFSFFTLILIILILRTYFVQNKYNSYVTGTEKNNSINKEKLSDYNYLMLDKNGKDLNSYNRKYKVFINGKTFALNAKNQNLDELISFNYILKEEIEKFSIDEIAKKQENRTYEITEESYNKINKLTGLKGIYVYEYDEIINKKDRSIENILMETTGFNIKTGKDNDGKSKNSLEMLIDSYVKDNVTAKEVFEKDIDGIYNSNNFELNKNNNNIKLTLDKNYQEIVRNILKDEKYNIYENIAVAITEGDSGKIVAMAQRDESKPNLITGAGGIMGYEPGSTFKIITLEAAMKYLGTSLADQYNCTGVICKKEKVHGYITVEKAMEVSCNDVFAILGNKIGKEKLVDFAKEQGYFNYILNLDEVTGMEAKGAEPGEGSTAGITAIGQTILATPLQVLGSLSTIVNDGVYKKPYIIDSVENLEGTKIKEFTAETKEVLEKDKAMALKNLLIKAVNDGSGIRTKINGIEVGGKTGTAEANGNAHGWFLGFFKNNNKYYNMVIFIPNMPEKNLDGERSGGGNTAGPIFKEIILALTDKK